ncbi:MAG: sulfatase-like hydrolase/transferase [Planctomycetota bacterium]|nr:sulfatase-like hydrolase/transferase [Planctomycetota bacterium]
MYSTTRALNLGLTVFVALATSVFAAEQESTKSPPNIVVVLCDDLGYGDLSCYGHMKIKTPHLDRFASEGLRLTDCYASAPVCSPSRCGLLTGRTPIRLAVDDWIPPGSEMHMAREELTITTLLQKKGYATAIVGKWHCNGKFNSTEQPQPSDHGFQYWFCTQNNADPSHLDPVNFVRNGKEVGKQTGYSSTIIVDESIRWLRKHSAPVADGNVDKKAASQPFCLFVWFHTPHEPVTTASEFTKRHADIGNPKQADYFGNVEQMDHEFGRLMSELDKLGNRDNTLVLFTSDNGPETLNRYRTADRSYGTAAPLRGMKLHLYEGGIRVPGLARWPGHIQAGSVSAEPVSNVDFLPTCCELAGIPLPTDRALDGTSLVPLFRYSDPAKQSPLTRKQPLYWQYQRAIGPNKIAVRDQDWKLLADDSMTKFELYNLRQDRQEAQNLAADPQHAANLASLKSKMAAIYQDVLADRPDLKPPVVKPRK